MGKTLEAEPRVKCLDDLRRDRKPLSNQEYVGTGEGRYTRDSLLFTSGVSSCTVLMVRLEYDDGRVGGILTHYPFFSWQSTKGQFETLVRKNVTVPVRFDIVLLVNEVYKDRFEEDPFFLQSFRPVVESLLGGNGTVETVSYKAPESDHKGMTVWFMIKNNEWKTNQHGKHSFRQRPSVGLNNLITHYFP